MLANKAEYSLRHQSQQGIALVVALVITVSFVLIGITIVDKSKTNTQVTGSNARYSMVFEAAEQTLRDAIIFIQSIHAGEPIATTNGAAGKDTVVDFKLSTINAEKYELVSNPAKSFVWDTGALEAKLLSEPASKNIVCSPDCSAGIDFLANLDTAIWNDYAIQSTLASNDGSGGNQQVDANNYVLNTTTYTFIQLLSKVSEENSLTAASDPTDASEVKNYYLITVKASGYEPGVVITADNARENVLLQAVYVQRY